MYEYDIQYNTILLCSVGYHTYKYCMYIHISTNHSHLPIPETEKVLINKTELDNVVYKNAKSLRTIGLEALLDLHAQMSQAVSTYASKLDRTKLPQDLNTIVTRYLQYAKK